MLKKLNISFFTSVFCAVIILLLIIISSYAKSSNKSNIGNKKTKRIYIKKKLASKNLYTPKITAREVKTLKPVINDIKIPENVQLITDDSNIENVEEINSINIVSNESQKQNQDNKKIQFKNGENEIVVDLEPSNKKNMELFDIKSESLPSEKMEILPSKFKITIIKRKRGTNNIGNTKTDSSGDEDFNLPIVTEKEILREDIKKGKVNLD